MKRNYRNILVVFIAICVVLFAVFGILEFQAGYGTEEKTLYRTFLIYTMYTAITGALIIGALGFFNREK